MTRQEVDQNLSLIRQSVDVNTSGCDIDTVVELGKKLSSLMGLAAECQSQAQALLKNANLVAINQLEKVSPSVMIKTMDAMCADDLARYEYASRISASITHKLDFIRTVVSLYKTELENSIK
jgi:hypothetical protein